MSFGSLKKGERENKKKTPQCMFFYVLFAPSFFQHFLTFYFCFRSMLQGETSFLIKFRLSSLISIFNNSFVKIKSIFWKVFFFTKIRNIHYTILCYYAVNYIMLRGLLLRKLNCRVKIICVFKLSI